ncbi:MAG: nitroreductase [Rhodospirillaceae bacterium]|nr:nitroreductase [Rhodospirillaceae bacterium]|tara:strand:+ start:5085 stop:5663 length:579 start_codon:yes stop_codon:yes gene_type:complete
MPELSDFLLSRRSVVVRNMIEPGPTEKDLTKILSAGMRVPDHGRLAPWRFKIIRGKFRNELGSILVNAYKNNNPNYIEEQLEIERERFNRAPIVILVISVTNPEHKIPEWEQILSSGAACQNILTSALSMGYAAQWITEWYAYDKNVTAPLGLKNKDRVAGFIYLGTRAEEPQDRTRPEYNDVVSEWIGSEI